MYSYPPNSFKPIQEDLKADHRKEQRAQSSVQPEHIPHKVFPENKLQDHINHSPRVMQQASFHQQLQNSTQITQRKHCSPGLPSNLKQGIERISGYAMDDVRVHYNSNKPQQYNALAYAQGTDIHLAPGQNQHLPHEAWHVVQQKQGRVKPTLQMKTGTYINDDMALENEADLMGAKAQRIGNTGNPPTYHQTPRQASSSPIQRMMDIRELAKLLTQNKSLRELSDFEQEKVMYWNTRDKFDGLSGSALIDEIKRYAKQGFEEESDDQKRAPGQTNSSMDLPDFMRDHYEFDVPLPMGIGTVSFRYGHQYVLGTQNNKWISNNITWTGTNQAQEKFRYLIHVILEFKNKQEWGWEVNPHITIRNEFEQLIQTGVAMISEPNAKRKAKKDNPEKEATEASYSLGLGDNERKPGTNMRGIPDEYIGDIFQPWLSMIKARVIPLNQIQPDQSVEKRHLWLTMKEKLSKPS